MVVEPFLKWKSGTPLGQCLPSQLNDSHYDACIFLNLLIAEWSHLDLRVESMVCVVLGTAVADPDSRMHGIDESLYLPDWEAACLAEALLLAELAR